MINSLFQILKSSETLETDDLEKLNTWVEFLIAKRRSMFKTSDKEEDYERRNSITL